MTERNVEIVGKVNDAFSNNDTEGFLAYCADDVKWTMAGDRTVTGKDAIRAFMGEMQCPEPPVFTVDEMIASGESVACYGAMSMTDGDGKQSSWTYCDIYQFRDGKIAELRSFVVMDKKEETATEASA